MDEQDIFELLHRMSNVTNRLIIEWNRTFQEDLGVSHILLLGHLHAKGMSRPSDLAGSLGLTPPTITHLSDKLIQRKLAMRCKDAKDRRISYLEITDEGVQLLNRAIEDGEVLRKKLFEKLPVEDRRKLLEIYTKMAEIMEAI